MKALSVRQPWAWLIVQGIKPVENRKWRTRYRGPLLIHAGYTPDHDGYAEALAKGKIPPMANLVFGAVIGRVELIDCVEAHDSEWFTGPYGFVLRHPEPFDRPVPLRGRLGLFEVDEEVLT